MLRVLHSGAEREVRPRGRRAAAYGEGFHGEERDDLDIFRWMDRRARILLPEVQDSERFLELWVWSPFFDLSQTLEVSIAGKSESFDLPWAWCRISIEVPSGAEDAELVVETPMPAGLHRGDSRTLTIQVRPPYVHTESTRHRAIRAQQANAALNLREMLDGKTELESYPPNLGIDLYGVCNVKPPCVYCEWDHSKELEGDEVDRPFTLETLDEYGEFFDTARNLINCSIGEPFMMKEFDDLLDRFGDEGKNLELATNGQILTDRNIDRLLGRPIDLYISLDAATPETYAKLRNDTLDKILVNLRRLLRARPGQGAYPRVNLVFMPMRVNLHELELFVALCAELRVDRLVLRPLNWTDSSDLDWERAGHHFVYADELLPFDELIRASGRAAAVCKRLGVMLSDQMDFGGATRETFEKLWAEGFAAGMEWEIPEDRPVYANAPPAAVLEAVAPPAPTVGDDSPAAETPETGSQTPAPMEPAPEIELPVSLEPEEAGPLTLGQEKLPICTEPWKGFYILRRGVLPCCYGGAPLAPVDDYRETWNSRHMRSIRKALAGGRFHKYCIDSPSCPLVRKHTQAGSLRRSDAVFVAARKVWVKFDRALGGVPGFFYRPVKRAVLGMLDER